MSRTLFALVAMLSVLFEASSARSATIAYFADGAFGDLTEETLHLQTALEANGHTVTPFTGTTAAGWQAAINAADILVIPELSADLLASLPVDTRSAIVGYVRSGGSLMVQGDFSSRSENLLNTLFGFALVHSGSGDPSVLNATAAAGTAFAGGPATLPPSDATNAVDRPSLPAGALALYIAPTEAVTVFAVDVSGAGRVIYMGYDWFEDPNPVDWVTLLGRAVTHADTSIPENLTVAVFEDSDYYNEPGEVANMKRDLAAFGCTVVPFVGVTAAEWQAALAGADVLVIPEVEDGDLPTDIAGATLGVISGFVASGGGLIIPADFEGPPPHLLRILNSGFGFALVSAGGSISDRQNAAALGTVFANGPVQLPSSNAVQAVTNASLPSGALALYTNGANTEVFAVQRGFGKIVYLGYDWFENPFSPLAWRGLLRTALQHVGTGPVGLVVTAPAVPPNTNAAVTANLTGFVGLTTASMKFRAAGDPAFSSVPLAGPANAMTANIPAAAVTARGVQFILEFTNGLITGTAPGVSNGARTLNLPVSLANHEFASLPAGGYQLRGVPVQASNPNPVNVFDELGAYNIKRWRYGTFNGTAYVEPNAAAFATPGQGFWIVSKDARAVATPGTSTDVSGPVVLTLRQGFNQIANPFAFPVAFAAVVRPAEVEANLIGFNGTAYVPGVTTLQPGEGYWIKNNGPGNRTISIPPLGVGVAAAPRPVISFAEGAEWALRVDARAGRFADEGNLFGARVGASEGRDAFDLSEPPPAPEGWVRAGFASSSDGELLCDWRPAGNDGATWQVSFASDQAGEDFSIDLSVERALPEGWSVLVFEGAREVELDEAMQISGRVGSTTAPRVFTVSVGSSSFLGSVRTDAETTVTTFSLAAPFPNPSSAGVSIDLAVPSPVADARVEVFDVQGRRVQTLLEGAVERGIQRVAWDGRTSTGERASAGVYFMKARAGSFSASRKVVLLP